MFIDDNLSVEQEKQLKEMNEHKKGRYYSYSSAIILAPKEYFGLQAN